MSHRNGIALLALLLGCATAPPAPPPRAANPADVATIDGLMNAFYEVVNVAPDAPRQWDRDRTLYAPWLHFVSIHDAKDGPEVTSWTHPEFVAATEPLLKAGFQERELKRREQELATRAALPSREDAEERERLEERLAELREAERMFLRTRDELSARSEAVAARERLLSERERELGEGGGTVDSTGSLPAAVPELAELEARLRRLESGAPANDDTASFAAGLESLRRRGTRRRT